MAPAPAPELDALIEALTRTETERSEAGQVIARGGMGQVEEYLDHGLQRRAARKVLPPGRRNDPQSVRLFIREAQITSYLDHPSIVPVHNVALNGSQLQFTMKLVEGQTLFARIADAPMPSRTELYELVEIIARICDALALAHSRGVVHCDVKPENIMTGRFGEAYLMDWGVARFLPGGAAAHAEKWSFVEPAVSDGVAGTLAYMAPEQARGEARNIGVHTDVFGLGATLYQALTGKPPYHDLSYLRAHDRATRGQFPSAREATPDRELPPALLAVLERALAPKIEDRYPDIDHLKADLMAFLHGEFTFPVTEFMAGDYIVTEGDSGDCAYIIEQGHCNVLKEIDGEQVLLRVLGPGAIFGETAVLSRGPRTASVVASSDVQTQLVTGDALLGEVETMRPWMGQVIRTLADRFRDRETKSPDRAPSTRRTPTHADLARRLVMLAATYGDRRGDDLTLEWDYLPADLHAELTASPAAVRQQLARYPQIQLQPVETLVYITGWRQLAERLRE